MNRKEWLEMRRGSIGASDAVILLRGPQFDSTEETVLESKLGDVEFKDGNDIRRGTLYEPTVLAEFARLEGDMLSYTVGGVTEAQGELFYKHGYCHASLDGLARLTDGSHLLVEVKCPRGKKATDTEHLGPTQEWCLQSRYQQAVYHLSTGTPRREISGVVVVWHSEEARYHKHPTLMTSNAEWDEAIGWVEYCHAWYKRHVIDGAPLERTAPPVAIQTFESSHLCTPNEAMICQWYARASAACKAAEADRKLASAALEEIATGIKARRLIADDCTITRVVQPGRTSLSLDKLRADRQDIEWTKYEKRGGDYVTWRVGK